MQLSRDREYVRPDGLPLHSPAMRNGEPRCMHLYSQSWKWPMELQCDKKFQHKGKHRFKMNWDSSESNN